MSQVCFHCNSTLDETPVFRQVSGIERTYCCNGCAELSSLLLTSGLGHFYEIRGGQKLDPAEIPTKQTPDSRLETESVYSEYVEKTAEGNSLVRLSIGGIHCSACVWLNETALSRVPGVVTARMNFATSRLNVEFDRNKTNLSGIFECVRKLGYTPNLYSPYKSEAKVEKPFKDLTLRMVVAGFCWGNIMLFSAGLYAGYFEGMDLGIKKLFHYVSWILATPVYVFSGYPFWKGALESWKRRFLSMDTLLFLGVSLAYFYSAYVTLTDRGEVYFDSVCTIYFFILLGKYLEAYMRYKAGSKVGELLSLLPEEYEAERDGIWKKVSTSVLAEGDRIKLVSGSKVPVDGILESENGYFDESVLTGESEPVHKVRGDFLRAGSIHLSGAIFFRALGTSSQSTLAQIGRLLEESLLTKPKLQRTTDKLASVFVKIVLLVALGTFLYWWGNSGTETAVLNTISVLIVACPCALGLSVPAALVVSHLLQSQAGILVKNPESTETLAKADRIFFDKTGTLTTGKLELQEEKIFGEDRPVYYRNLAYSLETNSSHPLAKSLVRALGEKSNDHSSPETFWKEIREIPGFGIEAKRPGENGNLYRIGNRKFAFESESKNDGWIYFTRNLHPMVAWKFGDSPRSDAKKSITLLKSSIPHLQLLSGDSSEKVERLAGEIGIQEFEGDLSPEQKRDRIREAQKKGETVVMVGDGINDSACIAQANLGISMGMGSDLSLDRSDLILVQNRLDSLPKAVSIAKTTRRIILQNIALSLTYNSIMIPIAALGYMLPVICAGFMTLSSITVVLNSVSLKRRIRF
ncbi:cadmium-translocating P-type ATPase [Leptospira fluminis]|uniref:Cadmium-translocating P-type ATPase n=1 Tax=Leptospira fluminis TaxID=2484979 RepID=A0A4R9GMK1_9LEPT|nr:heavy metal translocating P-type ATPase [Leptospira fluminis]TGK17454.1 cadmium-translocating P-type ATPase [Leptospira fluminis]